MSDRETSEAVSDGRLGWGINRSPPSFGVPAGVRLAWRTEGSGSARKTLPLDALEENDDFQKLFAIFDTSDKVGAVAFDEELE